MGEMGCVREREKHLNAIQVVMLCCVEPSDARHHEADAVLEFATRVKEVKTQARRRRAAASQLHNQARES